ncbi:MAG: type II toxin-antitoxin system VapC family toxin, partial [Candidatus Acidiferrales bacterium]
MSFLLDTNVVSELVKPGPDENVVGWLEEADEDELYLSVMTFAELRHGVEALGEGRRREALTRWISEDLSERFEGRIIAVERTVAEAWGAMMGRSERRGRALGTMDGLFAATAMAHGMSLVTRNTRHFERLGIELV